MARISVEEKERIKAKILDVSRELFYELGYDNTSTRMIAKNVGVAEGTIFNYFDSKSEIFFEVFFMDSMEHFQDGSMQSTVGDISTIICDHILSLTNRILKLPKKILYEMMIASIKMAKSKPEVFQKMASLDFKYMKEIEEYFDYLKEKNIIEDVDSKRLSEIVYGVIMFQFIMYFYQKDNTKDNLRNEIRSQINILLKGYIKGGNSNVN